MINIQDFIPMNRKNRPGIPMVPKWICLHDTANTAAYADAEAHAAYLQSPTAANIPVSWHFTVDGGCVKEGKAIKPPQIYQHLPLNEVGWHVGDGLNGPGNRSSIGIEICENRDGDRVAAEELAARLTAWLMDELSLGIDKVSQHNKWSGKDCPRVLRNRPAGWEVFLRMVQGFRAGPFVDVEQSRWSAEAIVWAAQNRIMVGTGRGKFEPGRFATREELAVVLWNFERHLKANS